MSLLPGPIIRTTERFYVRTRSGAWVESDEMPTIEAARKEMSRKWWRGRDPAIIKIVTTESIMEEGK